MADGCCAGPLRPRLQLAFSRRAACCSTVAYGAALLHVFIPRQAEAAMHRLSSDRHGDIAARGHEPVNDLAELIDRAIHVAPLTSDLGFVDLPAAADGVPARAGGLGEQWREALDPAVEGDVVDLHAAFGEELLDVAVRQRKAQLPAHQEHDHVGWEAEASEGRPADGWRARRSTRTRLRSPPLPRLPHPPGDQGPHRPLWGRVV